MLNVGHSSCQAHLHYSYKGMLNHLQQTLPKCSFSVLQIVHVVACAMATPIQIKIADLKIKVKPPLSAIYGVEPIEEAINELITFYNDEQFDDEDVTEDWDEFENNDGIEVFVKALNYDTLINNEDNQMILFNWFRYWLFPNTTQRPDIKPPWPQQPCSNHDDPIQQIANKLQKLFNQRSNDIQFTYNDTRVVCDAFVSICNDQGVQ